jgi:MFS family permease
MGYFYLGPLLGPLFAPIVGGALTERWGWRSTSECSLVLVFYLHLGRVTR